MKFLICNVRLDDLGSLIVENRCSSSPLSDPNSLRARANKSELPDRLRTNAWLSSILAHRIDARLNTVAIVNELVENAVGQCWIADLFVPARSLRDPWGIGIFVSGAHLRETVQTNKCATQSSGS